MEKKLRELNAEEMYELEGGAMVACYDPTKGWIPEVGERVESALHKPLI